MTGRFLRALQVAALAATALAGAGAAAAEQPFEEWLANLRSEALGLGIREATLGAAFQGVAPIPRVIELDRAQPEFTLTLAEYLGRTVPDARVQKGRERLARHKALLEEIARKHGVQPRFVVALWGIETDFGRVTGNFPVVPALATLAYDGRRSAYFRKELMDALRILDQGHIGVAEMKGSWAGAMGQCQFMPSSFISFAVDHDGDGRKDIWKNEADVLASAANYLGRSGWRMDQTWGRPVILTKPLDPALVSLDQTRTLSEWSDLGVRRQNGGELPKRELKASLVRPDARSDAVYLVYDNYRTILKWNRSHFFAVAVGTLADQLQAAGESR